MTQGPGVTIMNEEAVRRVLARMAREIVERNEGTDRLAIMGIERRGSQLAQLIRREIESSENVELPFGTLDITLYRDDLMAIGPRPIVGESKLPPSGVDRQVIVLVDDVLYTGRTIRSALNELTDGGRPSRIFLCVLVDRGGRELPIQPDVVGKKVEVFEGQRVEVLVPELDGRLSVDIVNVSPEAV